MESSGINSLPNQENKEQLKPRVLVAEDQKDILGLLIIVLQGKGCEVSVVSNGVLLFEELKERGPGYYSFVISDNNMEGGEGIDAIRKIRQMAEFNDTPIIFYTGDQKAGLKEETDSLEKVYYIHKTNVSLLNKKISELTEPKPPAPAK